MSVRISFEHGLAACGVQIWVADMHAGRYGHSHRTSWGSMTLACPKSFDSLVSKKNRASRVSYVRTYCTHTHTLTHLPPPLHVAAPSAPRSTCTQLSYPPLGLRHRLDARPGPCALQTHHNSGPHEPTRDRYVCISAYTLAHTRTHTNTLLIKPSPFTYTALSHNA